MATPVKTPDLGAAVDAAMFPAWIESPPRFARHLSFDDPPIRVDAPPLRMIPVVCLASEKT